MAVARCGGNGVNAGCGGSRRPGVRRRAITGAAMTGRDPAAGGRETVAEHTTDRPPEAAGTRPSHWDVATLCGETGEAILIHKGEHYRLRVTARGRLILTK